MNKIAIYYRVSTDRQDLLSQQHGVKEWLKGLKKQPHVMLTFEDEGISGKTVRRPGLQAMLKSAYKGKVDTIIVYRLDRLSRNASTAIRMILDLDEVGVAFISVTQPVLNLGHENPFRRTMLAAFAEIAEIERETIAARVKAGIEAARKRGVRLGAPAKTNDHMILRTRELRQRGLTIRDIAKTLKISVGTVMNMLREGKAVELDDDSPHPHPSMETSLPNNQEQEQELPSPILPSLPSSHGGEP